MMKQFQNFRVDLNEPLIFYCVYQGINTHKPAKCGWISDVAGNTITPTSHFGGLNFI